MSVQDRVDAVGFWWHSIDVGGGVVTPGVKTPEILAAELDAMDLPHLAGRSVLDIGGWDGFFGFEAERRGAARVAILDHYVWSLDLPAQQAYVRRCAAEGREPGDYTQQPFWRPDELPGRAGFDTARELRGSAVEPIVADVATVDPAAVGVWDVTFFLGVLYHLPDPLGALRRLAAMTGELAILETEAIVVPGHEDTPLWRLFPFAELDGDSSNWWAPNLAGLEGALKAAGFAEMRVTAGPPDDVAAGGVRRFRATVQAVR